MNNRHAQAGHDRGDSIRCFYQSCFVGMAMRCSAVVSNAVSRCLVVFFCLMVIAPSTLAQTGLLGGVAPVIGAPVTAMAGALGNSASALGAGGIIDTSGVSSGMQGGGLAATEVLLLGSPATGFNRTDAVNIFDIANDTLLGCTDGDGDNICDIDDQCPNTPAAVPVQVDGCHDDSAGTLPMVEGGPVERFGRLSTDTLQSTQELKGTLLPGKSLLSPQ